MGWFTRRRSDDPAGVARELHRRAIEEHSDQLAAAAAGTADGDWVVATNAYYAIGEWHEAAFTGACERAFFEAKLRPPPEPYVDIDRAVLVFGEDRDREYDHGLRSLAGQLRVDADRVVEADQRRQRYVEAQGLRREIADLLRRIGVLDRDEASQFTALFLDQARQLATEGRTLGDDPLLTPELGKLAETADHLRQRAATRGVPLDPPSR